MSAPVKISDYGQRFTCVMKRGNIKCDTAWHLNDMKGIAIN